MCNVIQEGSGSQAIQDGEECINAEGDEYCGVWLYNLKDNKQKFCDTETDKKECQKTCGVCKSNKCEDLYDDWNCKSQTNHDRYPCQKEEHQKTCMKTCGFCPDYCEDVHTQCSEWLIKDTKYGCNNPRMFVQCKKSCGFCPTKVCEDTDTEACPALARDGHCTESFNLEWVQKNCKKSCGLCNA